MIGIGGEFAEFVRNALRDGVTFGVICGRFCVVCYGTPRCSPVVPRLPPP